MTLIYLISALTIRTQHTKQERTTSGQEGQDKRPRPSVWLGQAHRASASREQPFRGTSAIVVRSSFDGASVAGAYRAHIDHAARADSDHAQRSRDELILGLLVGHAEAVAADSRAAHSPSAWYARAIANAAPPASAQRTARLEALKRETRPGRSRPWSAKPGDFVHMILFNTHRLRFFDAAAGAAAFLFPWEGAGGAAAAFLFPLGAFSAAAGASS
mmetsp:Transcript_75230/g.207534  ORF Transcript_75230/g.207534 Transcript_75230/m.207534 type:complete len:216 (+) Transcript_75230:332-979(+)